MNKEDRDFLNKYAQRKVSTKELVDWAKNKKKASIEVKPVVKVAKPVKAVEVKKEEPKPEINVIEVEEPKFELKGRGRRRSRKSDGD